MKINNLTECCTERDDDCYIINFENFCFCDSYCGSNERFCCSDGICKSPQTEIKNKTSSIQNYEFKNDSTEQNIKTSHIASSSIFL